MFEFIKRLKNCFREERWDEGYPKLVIDGDGSGYQIKKKKTGWPLKDIYEETIEVNPKFNSIKLTREYWFWGRLFGRSREKYNTSGKLLRLCLEEDDVIKDLSISGNIAILEITGNGKAYFEEVRTKYVADTMFSAIRRFYKKCTIIKDTTKKLKEYGF